LVSSKRVEAERLREALKTVHQSEKAAIAAFHKEHGYYPSESDWHMFGFAVKNDSVFVTITDGILGLRELR